MNSSRLPLPSFSHRQAGRQARAHTYTRSSLELHSLVVRRAQRVVFQEQIQSMSSMFIHLIESKLVCQAVLFLCLVISRKFYGNGDKH